MSSIYKDIILDHYRNPRNFGTINRPTFSVIVANPLCGDEIKLDAVFENGKLKEVKFKGVGCAISQSSASLLTEYIKGKDNRQLGSIDKNFMSKLVGVNISTGRLNCLLLPLVALKKILNLSSVS